MTITTQQEASAVLSTMLAEVEDAAQCCHHDHAVGETFVQCLLCGDWDSHTDACPMPAIAAWLDRPGGAR